MGRPSLRPVSIAGQRHNMMPAPRCVLFTFYLLEGGECHSKRIVLICAIVCLLLALQWGGLVYSWKNSKVWGNLLGFGLIISVFIGIQIWQKDRATIPLRVMKQQTVLVSCVFTAFLSMALYT